MEAVACPDPAPPKEPTTAAVVRLARMQYAIVIDLAPHTAAAAAAATADARHSISEYTTTTLPPADSYYAKSTDGTELN